MALHTLARATTLTVLRSMSSTSTSVEVLEGSVVVVVEPGAVLEVVLKGVVDGGVVDVVDGQLSNGYVQDVWAWPGEAVTRAATENATVSATTTAAATLERRRDVACVIGRSPG
ncbi:MAG: hypothetical protein JO085_10960 [Acidimicrobiia bacterium]|nr:hypothetical protein [Acidimicrobiia bacterium]